MPSCPHCGFETSGDRRSCPLCGSELRGGGEDGRGDVAGRGPGDDGGSGDAAVAWEDPGRAFPSNLWQTWRESLLAPASFFPRLDHRAPLLRPVLYFLLVSVASAFLSLLRDATVGAPLLPGGAGASGEARLLGFFLTPFVSLVWLAMASLVYHFFVYLLASERRGLRATARVLCYGAGPGVLSAVPVVGPPVALVWVVVLQTLGIREAHRTGTGRALGVVLGPLLLAFALALAVVLLAYLAMPELPRTLEGWR